MIYRSRPAPGSTIARKFSKSYHKTLISAFMHIFRTTQFDSPPAFNKKVAQFMVGTKHTVVKEMQERGVTCKEGKYRMGFPIFKRLCKLMAAPGSAENLYARFWLTLEWSLISRAENCVNSHVNHLRRRDDSMIIFFINPRPTKRDWTQIFHDIFIPIQCYQSVSLYILWMCIFLATLTL